MLGNEDCKELEECEQCDVCNVKYGTLYRLYIQQKKTNNQKIVINLLW